MAAIALIMKCEQFLQRMCSARATFCETARTPFDRCALDWGGMAFFACKALTLPDSLCIRRPTDPM
ncbi:MAG: hypothetical protein MUC58_10775 [Rhizobiaceae bacterium]|nr:hypothetical protein [Rhizobiaceae bacterium]